MTGGLLCQAGLAFSGARTGRERVRHGPGQGSREGTLTPRVVRGAPSCIPALPAWVPAHGQPPAQTRARRARRRAAGVHGGPWKLLGGAGGGRGRAPWPEGGRRRGQHSRLLTQRGWKKGVPSRGLGRVSAGEAGWGPELGRARKFSIKEEETGATSLVFTICAGLHEATSRFTPQRPHGWAPSSSPVYRWSGHRGVSNSPEVTQLENGAIRTEPCSVRQDAPLPPGAPSVGRGEEPRSPPPAPWQSLESKGGLLAGFEG